MMNRPAARRDLEKKARAYVDRFGPENSRFRFFSGIRSRDGVGKQWRLEESRWEANCLFLATQLK